MLLRPSYRYFNVAPLPELIVRPQRPLIPKMVLLSALTVILLTDPTICMCYIIARCRFVPADLSPIKKPLLIVSGSLSGTIAVYEVVVDN